MQIVLHENFEQATLVDEQVFTDLYRQYFVKLYRFAISVTHCKEASEEIVHDVLMNLWKKRHSFKEIENLNTYLYVSVKNLSLNYLRNQGKHIYVDVEILSAETTYISVDPESVMISKEQVNDLNLLINNLPVKCRIIFKLIKEDGLKYKDAAALLNISVKTVENQMAIALKKISSAFRVQK
ncbi:RNA polymerase sigma-70 factor [Mucilaginibacter sp.]